MRNQMCSGLVASLLALALTACGGGGGELVIRLELPSADCMTTPFHTDCDMDDDAVAARQTMCLADTSVDGSCLGNDGIATLFCKDNPNHQSPACIMLAPVTSTATSICGAGLDPFASVCDTVEDINDVRVEHCLQGSNVTMANCIALNNVCVNDTFSAACEAENLDDLVLAQAYFAREQHCTFSLSGGPTGAGTPACAGYEACTNNNPFGSGCTYSGFSRARATRVSFCTAGATNDSDPNHANCTGQNVGGTMRSISYCISTNPFDNACTNDAFNSARRSFVDACNVPNPNPTNCGQIANASQTITNCITSPFHADCTDTAFNGVRVKRIIACGAATPANGVVCTEAHNRVTTAVLLRSFTGNDRLDLMPDIASPRNQFLQGIEYNGNDLLGLDVGTAQASNTNSARPRVISLNLATATFQRQVLGGDASDGVAFFFGTVGSESSAYAGILAGTDLGARLTEPSETTATWHGQFQTIESTPISTDFNLNITFGAAGGTINAFVQTRAGSRIHYLIDGNFDTSGVITGMVNYGEFTDSNKSMPTNGRTPNGQLTGLIGQEGAVGAFIRNNQSSGFNYAGGFVACPLHADGRCENASR